MAKIFTEEMKNFIFENYKGRSLEELTILFNKKFNVEYLVSQIRNFCGKKHLKSGIENRGQFKKGHTSWLKGKKLPAEIKAKIKASKTMFSKLHKPANSLPVGTERYAKNGYIEIKVCGDKYKTASGKGQVISQNTKWIPKQQKVWIDNYGDIPPKHKVVFLDKNKFNFDISNLECVSCSLHFSMCMKNRYTNSSELTKTALTLTKLEKAIIKSKKVVQ